MTPIQISNFQFHDLRDSLHQLISLDPGNFESIKHPQRGLSRSSFRAGDLLDIADKAAANLPPKLLNDQWFSCSNF